MKKIKKNDIRSEYSREELGRGLRGNYFQAYQSGTNLVLLKPDIATPFPIDTAVNEALRSLLDIARQLIGITKRSSRRADR